MTRLRSASIFLLKLLITLVPGYFVWRNIAATPGMNSGDFWNLLGSLDPAYLVVALLCLGVSNLTGCAQWRVLLATQGISKRYTTLLRVYFVGLFFNNFMPGNIGGDFKKVYDLRADSGQTVGAAFSATVFDRIFGLFFLNVLALTVGVLFFLRDPAQRYFLLPSFWVFLGFVTFMVALFSRRAGRQIGRVVRRVLPERFAERFARLQNRFHDFRNTKLWSQLIVISAVTQILRVLVHYFCGRALGVDINVSWYFYYIPMVAVVSALPISIGGFGPRELLAQSLFARAGVGSMQSVVIQLLAYLVSLAISLLGALEFLRRKGGKATP
jgi:glycosyltransferase 2 family protein